MTDVGDQFASGCVTAFQRLYLRVYAPAHGADGDVQLVDLVARRLRVGANPCGSTLLSR